MMFPKTYHLTNIYYQDPAYNIMYNPSEVSLYDDFILFSSGNNK